MKVQPIKKYKTPSYPTRKEFLSQKNNLQNNLPNRWLNNKVVAGALAFLFLGNNSDTNTASVKPDSNTIIIDKEKLENPVIKNVKTDENLPSIAPLFIYGDGRGASGCVVINPPVFMSEADARAIIESELMKEGIIFDKKNYHVENLFFDENYEWNTYLEESEDDFSPYSKKEKHPVEMDAYSSDLNLAYEFVAVDDYYKFGGEISGSTAQGYDLIEAAENLRAKMKKYGKINTVIFYDPLVNHDREVPKNDSYDALKSWSYGFGDKKDNEPRINYFTAKNEESVILLKKQINDFIKWIKKEGLLSKK